MLVNLLFKFSNCVKFKLTTVNKNGLKLKLLTIINIIKQNKQI